MSATTCGASGARVLARIVGLVAASIASSAGQIPSPATTTEEVLSAPLPLEVAPWSMPTYTIPRFDFGAGFDLDAQAGAQANGWSLVIAAGLLGGVGGIVVSRMFDGWGQEVSTSRVAVTMAGTTVAMALVYCAAKGCDWTNSPSPRRPGPRRVDPGPGGR
jgi:hypothetical protein